MSSLSVASERSPIVLKHSLALTSVMLKKRLLIGIRDNQAQPAARRFYLADPRWARRKPKVPAKVAQGSHSPNCPLRKNQKAVSGSLTASVASSRTHGMILRSMTRASNT